VPRGVAPPAPVALANAELHDEHPAPDRAAAAHTVRVATVKLESLFRLSEEMLSFKLTGGQRAADLRDLTVVVEMWRREWGKVESEVRRVQQHLEKRPAGGDEVPLYAPLVKLVAFLEWSHQYVKGLDARLRAVTKSAEQDTQSFGGMVDTLLEDAKKVLMLPFSALVEAFPRMVRDLSRSHAKEAELVVHGAHVEIDKRILDELRDPLTHVLRNCIDHGIETPSQRTALGKPARGTVTIAVTQVSGDQVEIIIADDGAGIELEKVKDAAVRCGVLSERERATLSAAATLPLIFHSEVSTSAAVTDISGRGLGMAIVRDKLEKLGGHIAVQTQPTTGTTFRLLVPLTLATLRGIVVEAGQQTFVVPTMNVERVIRVPAVAVQTIERKETISLNERTLPLVRLSNVLEIPARAGSDTRPDHLVALVIGAGERRIAFVVDRVLNEQEVLFKSLGKYLARVRNVAGATVLGSGQVVPILDVPDLMLSAAGAAVALPEARPESAGIAAPTKSILVAEDSITSRMLLKEILESAGYHVTTAVDGLDALTTLEKERFDLLLSDIEMPRMNGFDLTTKVRTHDRYARLPVVLVTGLESQLDRARGLDVGANAYIVKSSFDQSNLLDVIQRLV